MILKNWSKEFYPIHAADATENDLVAIDHCIKKWKGALPKNLKKHGVAYKDHTIYETDVATSNSIDFNGDTCALCQKYQYVLSCKNEIDGTSCPIVRKLGQNCEDIYSRSGSDPKPMLKLLYKTKKFVKAGN